MVSKQKAIKSEKSTNKTSHLRGDEQKKHLIQPITPNSHITIRMDQNKIDITNLVW